MNTQRFFLLVLASAMGITSARTQTADFHIALEKIEIPDFPGLQSAAVGQVGEQIVLLGGRTDGLHRRQPFAAFLPEGNNMNIVVLTPSTGQFFSVPVNSLPAPQQEQLGATNIQFCQDGPWLYLVGGYGFSAVADDHVTYPMLTVVRLDSLIKSASANESILPWFQSVTDQQFAVSGGQLVRQGEVFYLAGGHRFDGRYNPMNHPTFVQTYTNAIRRFSVENDGDSLTVTHLPEWHDEVSLQRRDYNLVPQIFPDGHQGFTMFSGVFAPIIDLPYLNSVDFDSTGFAVNNSFQHRLNQYHCAKVGLYDAVSNKMQTVFFGGIAQFYFDQSGQFQQDDNVPFVRTVGRITRQPDGAVIEEKIGELPGFLGAGAEFLPLAGLPMVSGTEILRLDQLSGDSSLIGYLVGGIESDLPNVFFDNQEEQSRAHPAIYAAYFVRDAISTGVPVPEQQSPLTATKLTPNPAQNMILLTFTLSRPAQTSIVLQTQTAQTIVAEDLGELPAGEHRFEFRLENFPKGIYPVSLVTNQFIDTIQLIIAR